MNFKKHLNSIILISLAFLSTIETKAQFSEILKNIKKQNKNSYSSFGIGGGSTNYFGDLSPYSTFYYGLYTNVRFNGTLNYIKQFDNQNGLRVSYSFVRILGNDFNYSQRNIRIFSDHFLRNLSFRNDINEFLAVYTRNILPSYEEGFAGRRKFMPFATIGLGLITNTPKTRKPYDGVTNTKGGWITLSDLSTSGQGLPGNSIKKQTGKIQGVLPVSLGMKMRLNAHLDLSFEAGFRLSTTDYLDDVGNMAYPDAATLTSIYGPDAAAMSYRAGEGYDAFKGTDRTGTFRDIATKLGFPITATTTPASSATTVYPTTTNKRGTARPDSYLVTQLTLNYVLGNRIKCPVLR